jgi:hypothetical protein
MCCVFLGCFSDELFWQNYTNRAKELVELVTSSMLHQTHSGLAVEI